MLEANLKSLSYVIFFAVLNRVLSRWGLIVQQHLIAVGTKLLQRGL